MNNVNYHARSSYSKTGYTQSEEETYILRYAGNAGKGGRFLDIGAYDGITFSNTRALLERGWSGVYVEPSPYALEKLRVNTVAYAKQVEIVAAAVSDSDGYATFYPCEEMVGSLLADSVPRWQGIGVKYGSPIQVQTYTPKTLMESIGNNFDMVSIDVEGINKTVFNLMPWKQINAGLIIMEHDSCGKGGWCDDNGCAGLTTVERDELELLMEEQRRLSETGGE